MTSSKKSGRVPLPGKRKVISSFIGSEKVEAMCRRVTDDKYIAEYLGCTTAEVARIRARQEQRMHTSRRVSHYDNGDPFLSTSDVREASLVAASGSRDLLIAQLKYGQHWLEPNAFWDTVGKLRQEGCVL